MLKRKYELYLNENPKPKATNAVLSTSFKDAKNLQIRMITLYKHSISYKVP